MSERERKEERGRKRMSVELGGVFQRFGPFEEVRWKPERV